MKYILIALTIFTTACSFGGSTSPLKELTIKTPESQIYKVSPGDTLMVEVWGESKLSGERLVREDGRVTLPLAKDIPAKGKTLEELETDISEALKMFVPAASVNISVISQAPVRFYLTGSFLRPGEFYSEGDISFLAAVAKGGGFAPFANDSDIILIRKTSVNTGEDKRYRLNYSKVVSGRHPNPRLISGDIIAVE